MSQAIVIPEAGTLETKESNGEKALTPINYLVSQLAIGENPNEVHGVPLVGSLMDFFGTIHTCDKVGPAEWIKDLDSRGGGVARVTAYFSTNGKWEILDRIRRADTERNYDIGYKKVPITYPTFRREPWRHTNPANPTGADVVEMTWKREDKTRNVTWEVLSTNVVVTCADDIEIRNVINAAQAQHGHLHIFPAYPNKKWVMLPCGIKIVGKKVALNYSWESDPGSGFMAAVGGSTSRIYPNIRRLPFTVIDLDTPLDTPDRTPTFGLADMFPTNDTEFYTPLGWQTLPGSPV